MLEIYTDGASRGNPGKSAIAYVLWSQGRSLNYIQKK